MTSPFFTLRQALADDERKPEVDAVAEKDAGEGIGQNRGRTHVQDGGGRVLPSWSRSEVGPGDDEPS
jgi:hypothetical protein